MQLMNQVKRKDHPIYNKNSNNNTHMVVEEQMKINILVLIKQWVVLWEMLWMTHIKYRIRCKVEVINTNIYKIVIQRKVYSSINNKSLHKVVVVGVHWMMWSQDWHSCREIRKTWKKSSKLMNLKLNNTSIDEF